MNKTQSGLGSFERGLAIAKLMADGVVMTSALIQERFDVSHATAKRHMLAIELVLAADRETKGRAASLRLPRRAA